MIRKTELIKSFFKDRKEPISLKELYFFMNNTSRASVRGSVNNLTKKGKLKRIKKGLYVNND